MIDDVFSVVTSMQSVFQGKIVSFLSVEFLRVEDETVAMRTEAEHTASTI